MWLSPRLIGRVIPIGGDIRVTATRRRVYGRRVDPISVEGLRASFVNCSKGQAAKIDLPEVAEVPWGDLDFLAWRSPRTPQRACLVAPTADGPVGVVLRVAQARGTAGAMRSSMCEYCHTVHSSGGVTLLTATKAGLAGRRGDSVGSYICSDLDCSLYIRGRKRPSRVQPQSTMTLDERIERLRLRLAGLVSSVVSPPV